MNLISELGQISGKEESETGQNVFLTTMYLELHKYKKLTQIEVVYGSICGELSATLRRTCLLKH